MKWLLLLLLSGCGGLTASEVSRYHSSGMEVYGCTFSRFGLSDTSMWIIVPREIPVTLNYADCGGLKIGQ